MKNKLVSAAKMRGNKKIKLLLAFFAAKDVLKFSTRLIR